MKKSLNAIIHYLTKVNLNAALIGFALIGFALIGPMLSPLAWAGVCPSGINDRADVAVNPAGNDYDVYFTDDDMSSSDFFDATRANQVRDALANTHNIVVNAPHNFANPSFSANPNDTCISDSANLGTAPENRITLDSPGLVNRSEPYIRNVVAHELFHHVQYSYIDFSEWPSWGGWTIEATPRAMEDKFTLDNDTTPANTLYVGEVNNYLNNPNRTLMDISYTAALFWTYLTEQLGSPFPEPARGVDVIQRFWALTQNESPDSIKILRETIDSFGSSSTLEDWFLDFAITNYTHDLDVSLLSNPNRYRYFDETVAGGNTPYNAVARTTIPSINNVLSDSVVRWGARYFEVNVPSEQICEAVGFWGKTKNGKSVGWALIGIKNGNQVTTIYRTVGSTFYRALINSPGDTYDKLALVVIGLNNAADFDYAFGWGPVSGDIRRPTLERMAYVGEKDEPKRFQARLEMLGPSVLTPSGSGSVSLRGLDPALFEINLRSVGTGASYPVAIVNASYVSGEYWLTLQAPQITNPADGDLYDLIICFCRRSGACTRQLISSKSVLYADITMNQMLTLDRSFSMHYPLADPKITAAKNAARMFVNSADDADRLGVVTFSGDDNECNTDAVVEFPMNPVAGNRNNAIAAIDSVVEDGWTSIGDGIIAARNQLLTATDPVDRHALVLLSDGLENEGDFWANANGSCATPPVQNSFDPSIGGFADDMRIDTIAFGSDADQALLTTIATFTDGDYYAVRSDAPSSKSANKAFTKAAPSSSSLEVANRLANVYRSIEEDLNDQDRLFFEAHALSAGVPTTITIPVTEKEGGGVIDAVFAFNWNDATANVSITLIDPFGATIFNGAPWQILSDQTNEVYQYDNILDPGTWTVEVTASNNVQLIAMLSGRIAQGVDINLYLSRFPHIIPERCKRNLPLSHLRGLPVTVIANLNDTKGGINGLSVAAEVENSDGSLNRIVLFDDGHHDDGLAGDGVYANRYTRTPFYSSNGVADFPAGPPTGNWGSYTVTVRADGESNFGEVFSRSEIRSFHVYEYGPQQEECIADNDKDGLPDRWEDLYGLDSTDPSDAGEDPDNDKLNNKEEFFYGTLPLDPDTDDGGESDGSEVNNGRDPLYTLDDLLPPIIDYGIITQRIDLPIHLPQPETNILHFPANPNYQIMQIWRTDPGWAGFQQMAAVDVTIKPRGVYYDKGLTNGFPYQYYLIAEGLSNSFTAPTDIFGNAPKADSLPPKGWVMIASGAIQIKDFNSVLQLDTSDDAKEVLLSEQADFQGAVWQPLKSELPFAFNPTAIPALVTVYAKFRDAAFNESVVYHDSTVVDPNVNEIFSGGFE